MDPEREGAEFERIEQVAKLERARGFIAQYEQHLLFYRRQVEDVRYELGRLDERLG